MRRWAFKEAIPIIVPIFVLLTIYNLSSGLFVRVLPGNPWGIAVNGILTSIGERVLGTWYITNSCNGCYVYANIYLDFLVLLMLGILFVAVWRRNSLLKAVQVDSFIIMILPLEIYLTDSWAFNTHVTRFQEYFNFIPWFTNADLLWVALTVFASTVVITVWRKIRQ